jgi:hypothetical protein
LAEASARLSQKSASADRNFSDELGLSTSCALADRLEPALVLNETINPCGCAIAMLKLRTRHQLKAASGVYDGER